MQTVLITGASSGIGEGLARQYARQGARVVLLARRLERLQGIANELQAAGAQVSVHQADVTQDGAVSAVIAALADAGIAIDVVYANAGFGVAGSVEHLALADYQRQFDTNVFGLLRTVKEVLPALQRSRGQLVLMGSVAGYAASAGMSAYSMSKFAVRALAETLHSELRPAGIHVTLVSPGFVDSDIRRTDNQGVLQPDAKDPIPVWLRMSTTNAVRQIIRAVAKQRAEVVITGHGKLIVWLARHLPGLTRAISRRIYRGRPEPR